MAHYIGKFNSENELRTALNNGTLLNPYVAYIGDDVSGHLDYNSYVPMTPGIATPTSFTIDNAYSSYLTLSIQNSQDKVNDIIPQTSWLQLQTSQSSWGNRDVTIYVTENALSDRVGDILVNFYTDDTRQELVNTVTLSVSQPGLNQFCISFEQDDKSEHFYTWDYVSGSTSVYIFNNPYQYWLYEDVETGQHVTGTTSDTSFIAFWNENETGNQKTVAVPVQFSDYPDFQVISDTKWVYVILSPNPNMSAIDPTNGYVEWSGGDAYFTISLKEDADSWEIVPNMSSIASAYTFSSLSGSSDVGLTVTVPENQDTQNWSTGYFNCVFYKNGQTVSTCECYVNQPQKPSVVTVVGTFVTTSDNETLNVPNGDGFEYGVAILDNSDQVDVSNGTYTFANAGTHTLTYSRASNDTYLQGWFMNSDVVSVGGSSNAVWGCHNNQYYQQTISMTFAGNQSLTGATFDSNFDRIGSSCFSGCTSLVSISIANPNGVYMGEDAYPFDTITANAGTLHIPSGSTSNFTNVINALGQNWTVVDDL